MATFAAVAPYIATMTQLTGIILADEFFNAESDIFMAVSNISCQSTSCVLNQGILPM